jgi:hypothetical protein
VLEIRTRVLGEEQATDPLLYTREAAGPVGTVCPRVYLPECYSRKSSPRLLSSVA